MLTSRTQACRLFTKSCTRLSSTVTKAKEPLVTSRQEFYNDTQREHKIAKVEQLFERLTTEHLLAKENKDHQRNFETEAQAKRAQESILPVRNIPSIDQQNFLLADVEQEGEFITGSQEVKIGDFVEIRRNTNAAHGVILDVVLDLEGKQKFVILLSNGEVWPNLPMDIQFHVPNFLDINSVLACGNGFFETRPKCRAARLSVVQRLRAFEREVEGKFRGFGRHAARLYPLLASSDPTVWNRVTARQALTLIDPSSTPSVTALLAMHKHLMSRETYFVCDEMLHFRSQTFCVRSRRDVENIERIKEWVVTRSKQLTEFVAKSARLITESRKKVDERAIRPLGVEVNNDVKFSPSDMEFIHFLKCSVRNMRSIQDDPYVHFMRTIVQSVQLYRGVITAETAYTFLKEIGIFAPWDDPVVNDHATLHFKMPLEDVRTMEEDLPDIPENYTLQPRSSIELSATSSSLTNGSMPSLADSNEFYKFDTVESKRHDFGDLPVFVIDSANAEELDDGVSVEPVQGTDSTWIHIHVADPTAILPPDHIIARQAEIKFTSLYHLQETWPMLPQNFTKHMHMGAAAGKGPGLRTMTFSALIDSSGDIQDYEVRPGIVRNVHVIPYDDINEVMGWEQAKEVVLFKGSSKSSSSRAPSGLFKFKFQIQTLFEALDRVRASNDRIGFLVPRGVQAEIECVNRPLPAPSLSVKQPHIYYGKMDLNYITLPITDFRNARDLVAECMKIAGRVCSLWFLKNGIPGLRRALPRFEAIGDSTALDELTQEQRDKGFVHFSAVRAAGLIEIASSFTLESKMHAACGAREGEGYIKCTSPLRRFTDLVHHWQIKHILAGGSPQTVPFSHQYLAQNTLPWFTKDRVNDRIGKRQTAYWAAKIIQDATQLPSDDPRSEPLKDLIGTISGTPRWDPIKRWHATQVHIPTLGVGAKLITPTRDEVPGVGQDVPIKIDKVVMGILPSIHLSSR